EQRLEHGFSRVHGRRLTRTHDAVDVEQSVFTRLVLVHGQRVAQVCADGDVVDIEDRQLVKAEVDKLSQQLLVDLIAGFSVDFAGLEVDDVLGNVGAEEVSVDREQMLQAFF